MDTEHFLWLKHVVKRRRAQFLVHRSQVCVHSAYEKCIECVHRMIHLILTTTECGGMHLAFSCYVWEGGGI